MIPNQITWRNITFINIFAKQIIGKCNLIRKK